MEAILANQYYPYSLLDFILSDHWGFLIVILLRLIVLKIHLNLKLFPSLTVDFFLHAAF